MSENAVEVTQVLKRGAIHQQSTNEARCHVHNGPTISGIVTSIVIVFDTLEDLQQLIRQEDKAVMVPLGRVAPIATVCGGLLCCPRAPSAFRGVIDAFSRLAPPWAWVGRKRACGQPF